MKRVLVTGGRDWVDVVAVRELLIEHGPCEVVHGDCPSGADRIAHDLMVAWGWAEDAHPAKWKKHGKGAGPRRNSLMVKMGAHLALAFPTGGDGTAGCMALIERADIPMVVTVPRWPRTGDTDAWKEWQEERAAIMEFDGQLPRQEAETEARALAVAGFREQRLREQWVHD